MNDKDQANAQGSVVIDLNQAGGKKLHVKLKPAALASPTLPVKALRTELLLLVDKSYSMQKICSSSIEGYNSFIQEQKAEPGECKVTLSLFNHTYSPVYSAIPISEVPELTTSTYKPAGNTALYDSMAQLLNDNSARIESERWAEVVIVMILTDGEENSSKKVSLNGMKELISVAESKGWKFVYLAANQDAIKATRDLGMQNATPLNFAYNDAGIKTGYTHTSRSVASLRTGV